jgi:tetratricopeptide (TPR) repeat protein
MSRKVDPSKAAEAKSFSDAANKALSTSMLKWKPDYIAAEPLFQQAARAYKLAGLMDSATEAWKQAIQCSIKMSNLKQAIVTLEATSRELVLAANSGSGANAYKEQASAMLSEAGTYLNELNEAGRAADFKLRAGKLLEGFNNEAAAKLYEEACSYFDGDEDKDVYAKEALSKALNHQLGLGKHASAMRTMDKLAKVYVRLNQPHNLYKLILSRVILLLAAADPVAAQKEYDKHMDAMDFMSSTEAGAAEDLIAAYSMYHASTTIPPSVTQHNRCFAGDLDSDAVKAVTDKNVFNYLDHAVTKIAKSLVSAVTSGKTVGAAHADETATKAISHTAATAGLPPGFRSLGGSSGLNNISSLSGDAAVTSNKAVAAASNDRAALFAKGPAPGTHFVV